MRYVNPRNNRGWETSAGDINPAGFINVLSMMNGDVVECYQEVDGKWAKLRNGLYLSKGKIHAMGSPPPKHKRRKRRK